MANSNKYSFAAKTFLVFLPWLLCAQTTVVKSIGTAARNYSTITLWEAGEQGNLTTLNEVHKGECYNDAVFDETISISGSTTDATRYMHLSVAAGQRNDGVTLSTGARIVRSVAADPILGFSDPFCRVDYLGFSSTANAALTCVWTSDTNILIERVLVADINIVGNFNFRALRVGGSTARTGIVIRNCIVKNVKSAGSITEALNVENSGAHTVSVFNCTFVNVRSGCLGSAANATTTMNNVVVTVTEFQCFDFFAGVFNSENNASNDGSAVGSGSLVNIVPSDVFVSATVGSENVNLKAGSVLINAGKTNASFNTDFYGIIRPQGAAWEIGATEFVGAAPPAAGRRISKPIWWH